MVEVDASDTGVGSILLQHSSSDQKLHPCAFSYCSLSLAEQNYDMGNTELLAVKLALEEWRHWLKEAEDPFIAWMDHKNFAYIQTAKRLNSRQAWWSLFFPALDLTLTTDLVPATLYLMPSLINTCWRSPPLLLTPSFLPPVSWLQ